ncbi:MAG: nicotinate-nucleotide adenylyltransferase [Paraglaciecola sp.]|jgi:nicotinate-nucleotide adenylyltransferase
MRLNPPLGIFGGTFDPIHIGHIQPVMEAADQLSIQQIALIPCHIPPHKNAATTSSEHRLAMVKLVCQQYPLFFPDGREIKRDKASYSTDTLKELRRLHPMTPLCFFIGMDSLLSLPTWHNWQELFELCHFVVCQRGGQRQCFSPQISQLLKERQVTAPDEIRNSLAGHIIIADINAVDISSTKLRARLAKHQCVDGLIPKPVLNYIQQHGLYAQNT